MAKYMKRYDLLISCPGDAIGTVKVVEEVVEEFNQLYSDALGILIRSRHWRKSAYSESGGKPQELLNRQIVDDADLAVAIFKNRFGTPTDSHGSGTEEEIEKMLAEGKQVFMFFDESPVKMSEVDRDEYERVQHFKERYKDKGVFWTYSNDAEFKNTFRAHITQHFMSLSKDGVSEGKSNIRICSYRNGRIDDNVQFSLFDMGGFISSEKLIIQIQDAIKRVSKMKLSPSGIPARPTLEQFVGKKVEVEKSTIEIIKGIAEKMEIALTEDFFDLGNLTESPLLSNMPFGGRSLDGTDEEKEKYNAIIALRNLVYKTIGHMQMEQYYKDLYGVGFVLCNDGTRFDEDIDVEIVMPEGRFIDVEELPVPTEEINLGDDWCFAEIFEIPATRYFISYSDTKKTLSGFTPNNSIPVNPFVGRDYEEEYRETLRDIFDYQVYPDGKNLVIKIHFDYIKQHQRAAFPTWIFVRQPSEGLCAKYAITTKNNKSVIEGQINIKPRMV